MSQLSKDELFYIKQKYHFALTELINKLAGTFVFNMPIDSTEWPEMRKTLEETRDIIQRIPRLTLTEQAVVEKYKSKKGRPKGSKNKKKKTTNKPKKSLLECALNKQGISLSDIDKNYNPTANESKSQEVSEGNDRP